MRRVAIHLPKHYPSVTDPPLFALSPLNIFFRFINTPSGAQRCLLVDVNACATGQMSTVKRNGMPVWYFKVHHCKLWESLDQNRNSALDLFLYISIYRSLYLSSVPRSENLKQFSIISQIQINWLLFCSVPFERRRVTKRQFLISFVRISTVFFFCFVLFSVSFFWISNWFSIISRLIFHLCVSFCWPVSPETNVSKPTKKTPSFSKI